jgi:diguanylate cyclase (GGDEF)-like protein
MLLLVVGLVVIAAVAMTVAYATSHVRRAAPRPQDAETTFRPGARDRAATPQGAPDASAMPASSWPGATPGANATEGSTKKQGHQRGSPSIISPTSVRQVARVVAFLYLAAVAIVVALTRAWPDAEPAIFSLLALGTLLVVLFLDLVPPAAMGRWRRPAEALGAVVFLGLLTALTGGATSPFFVGFFLVVAGTALSTEGRAPLAIALLASATLALVGFVDALGTPLDPAAAAWVGFNAVALVLLADIATAAARAQRHARDEALRASRFDALTGLYNRGFYFTTMEQEIRRSERMDRGFAMLMLDLDDLKPVNDRFGHQWGDRLLRAVAETIRRTVRFTDAGARYGGDEFVVLLPETDAAGAYVVAEKLRRDIAAVTLHAADRVVRSSVSVGLVSYPDDGTTIEQLVAAADVAMYEAKRRGKNRVVGYQSRTERAVTAIEVEPGTPPAPLTPAGGEVRTGGDPAPWGSLPGTLAGAEPPLPRPGPGLHAITVAPDAVGTEVAAPTPIPAPPARPGADATRSPTAPSSVPPGASQPKSGQPGTDPPETSPPSASGTPRRPASTRERGRVTMPDPDDATPEARAADPPWLTRTDDSLVPPAPATGAPPPGLDARPAARRDPPSRSERIIRPGERPWIVLPIEPDESSGRPPA